MPYEPVNNASEKLVGIGNFSCHSLKYEFIVNLVFEADLWVAIPHAGWLGTGEWPCARCKEVGGEGFGQDFSYLTNLRG
jgi:hypothetical protein